MEQNSFLNSFLGGVKTSKVLRGVDGKVLLIYGVNNVGKTKISMDFEKPLLLRFEQSALNAMSGKKYYDMNSWSDFKNFVRNCKNALQENREEFEKNIKTLVLDNLSTMSKYLEKYVANADGKDELFEGSYGQLYTKTDSEAFSVIDDLLKLGLTLVFIAHQGVDEIKVKNKKGEDVVVGSNINPLGNSKLKKRVIDNCDLVLHLSPQGLDNKGEIILSTAQSVEHNNVFARSKWSKFPPYIEKVTAKKIEEELNKLIEQSEVIIEDKKEYLKTLEKEEINFNEIKQKALEIAKEKCVTEEKMKEYKEMLKKYLPEGVGISDCTKLQSEQIKLIYEELKNF